MKKSLFLGILPAVFALSACSGTVQPKEESKNLFLEDTLAHEEIFGDAEIEEEERSLAPRRMLDLGSRLEDPIDHPVANELSVGVQSLSEQTGYISFRFVAAVKFNSGELDPTEAKWRRTVSETDGDAVKAKAYIPCEKAYKKISNGGSAYSITDFNGEHSTDYTHFVVYTLRNVPVDANNYFVSAYLNLSPKETGGKTLISKAIAINADQSQKYTYTHDLGTAYMELTHNATTTIVNSDTIRSSQSDNKFAKSGLSFAKNDSYVLKEFFDTELFVKNSDCLTGEKNPVGYFFSDNSGAIKSNFKGTYDIYLNSSDQLWAQNNTGVSRPIYASQSLGWTGKVAIYAFNNADTIKDWFQMSLENGYWKTDDDVDPALYDKFIVVEGSTQPVSWSNKTDQTVNLTYPSSVQINGESGNVEDCFYVWNGENGYRNGSWGKRN